jgi:uncharacterized repeat protein (TIGR02543 family)
MASQSYYNARVVFGGLVDSNNSPVVGNSSKFGSATVMDNYTIGQQQLVVLDGTSVTFRANPKTTDGFKFAGWSFSNPMSRLNTNNPYITTVDSSDVTAYPVFAPSDSITYHRKIYLTIYGTDSIEEGTVVRDEFVAVSNMLGYYTHWFNSDGSYMFNNVSDGVVVNNIADGKDITLYTRNVDGYNVTVTVDGNTYSTVDLSGTDPYKETEYETEYNDRGGSGKDEDDEMKEVSRWKYVTIPNSASTTSDMNISVVYTPTAMRYNVTVNPDPLSGGTAIVYTGSSSEFSGTSINVNDGDTVTIEATPAAGSVFLKWSYIESSSEVFVDSRIYSYEVRENRNWTAHFTSSDPSITVAKSPSNGGTVYITAEGVDGQVPSTIYRSETSSDYVTIHAVPASNYEFQYWEINDIRHSTSILQNPDERVSFSDTEDITYTAVFSYKPPMSTTVKAYTSTIVDGNTVLMSGAEGVSFKAMYTNGLTDSEVSDYVGSSPKDLNVRIQQDGTGNYALINLQADETPITVEEDSHRYRYSFNNYKWADGYVVDPSSSANWQPIVSEGNTTAFKFYLEDIDKNSKTISAFYTRTELFRVDLSIKDSAGLYTGGEITVTGAETDYASGSTVTVTTSTTNTDKYVFDGWYDSRDTRLSQELSYSFTIVGNLTLVAKWKTRCLVSFSANPSNLGTVSCIDSNGDQISNGTRVDYGTQLTFTCTPTSGAAINYWTNGSTNIGTGNTINYIISGDVNVKANLMETSKTLTVMSNGGGSLSIYIKSSGSSNWVEVESGTDREYNVDVPSGSGYKVTASALPRYVYSGMKIYNSGGDLIEEYSGSDYSRDSLSEDRTITVDFSFIQWITTLGNIIKVY